MLGALAGALSGALGFYLAGKFHGNEKGAKIYPLYSATFYGLIVLTTRFLAH